MKKVEADLDQCKKFNIPVWYCYNCNNWKTDADADSSWGASGLFDDGDIISL